MAKYTVIYREAGESSPHLNALSGPIGSNIMKKLVFIAACALAFPAMADIVMPEPLHRIGYEVLAYAAGAAAALGGGLLAENRRRKPQTDAGFAAEWKDEDALTEEERKSIEAKLEAGLPFIQDMFDKRFEEVLPHWLEEDKKLAKDYTLGYYVWRARMSAWKSRNETLLKELLASDETLVQRLAGIPLEFLRDRLIKPMPADFTAGVFAESETRIPEAIASNSAWKPKNLWKLKNPWQ